LFTCQSTCFEEVVKEEKWIQDTDKEIYSIYRNDTWHLVYFPKDKYCISLKWVYKNKFNEKGEIERHEEGLVAKGFSQQPRIDFGENFAPMTRLYIVRIVISIVAKNKWNAYKMYVKYTFLNGIL